MIGIGISIWQAFVKLTSAGFRLLEGGGYRLLEDGTSKRKLE